jgi:hypothetical protein
MYLNIKNSMKIFVEENRIILNKYKPACIFMELIKSEGKS